MKAPRQRKQPEFLKQPKTINADDTVDWLRAELNVVAIRMSMIQKHGHLAERGDHAFQFAVSNTFDTLIVIDTLLRTKQ